MKPTNKLTPVQKVGFIYAKREDFAGYTSQDMPSGAKMRAYAKMIEKTSKDQPFIVGCSADSLMQVYVTAAAKIYGREAYVFLPARAKESEATAWAKENGGHLETVSPGYPSIYLKAARDFGEQFGGGVRWDAKVSLADTAHQVKNVPAEVLRIVVPCGSGAIPAGIVSGLALAGRSEIEVVCVAVSDRGLGAQEDILHQAEIYAPGRLLPKITMVKAPEKYSALLKNVYLADGTELDPAYAAKAYRCCNPGDLLWISGRRGGLQMPKNVKL